MMRLLLVLLLGSLIVACDRLNLLADRGSAAATEDVDDLPRSGHYERRFLFLDGRATPAAAVLDFTATVDPSGWTRRTAAVSLRRSGRWEAVVDTLWETPPMREPWRLVPHGPLRLLVGAADTIEALVYRGENRELRLIPSERLARWGEAAGTEVGLRRAELYIGRDRIPGILFDLRFRSELASPPLPSAPGDSLAQPAVAYKTFAFLTDGDEIAVTLVRDTARSLAWVRQGKEEERWDGIGLERLRASPTAWRVTSPGGTTIGELRVTGQPRSLPWPHGAPTGAHDYSPVRGWISVRGQRTQVSGLLGEDQS